MERDRPLPEPLVYLFMYVCQSLPEKEPSYDKEKKLRSPSTEPQADGRPTYNGVRPGSRRVQLCYCYYYRAVYSSPLLQDFAIVASVSQIRVSATLLVLAEGSCEIHSS
jgi:hypothetical protein